MRLSTLLRGSSAEVDNKGRSAFCSLLHPDRPGVGVSAGLVSLQSSPTMVNNTDA